MANPALFAKVLVGKHAKVLPKLTNLLQDIETLLVTLNSNKLVDVEAFRGKCNSILNYFHDDPNLRWNVQSPSVHLLLHHSADIVEFFQSFGFSISKTSEEGL